MDREGRRRLSAILLVGGSLLFVASLALPAVTMKWGATTTPKNDGWTLHVEGWTCATNYGPTAGDNSFLAVAFMVWGAAVWFRSTWAWWIGVGASVASVLIHALIGAWPEFDGIQKLHAGYWYWLAASGVVAASFLVLPRPERRSDDHVRTARDFDEGRAKLAWILGGAATTALVACHLLVPTVLEYRSVEGPGDDDESGTYETGPLHSGSGPSTQIETLPDGTKRETSYHSAHVTGPVLLKQYGGSATAAHEFVSLVLPLLFLAAATTRRAAWRWSGAAASAVAALFAFVWIGTPWSVSSSGPHPLDVAWRATPTVFLAACLLLPPRRAAAAPFYSNPTTAAATNRVG